MHRVPLLLGAVPKLIDGKVPLIPMRAGAYRVEIDGLMDSEFEIRTDRGSLMVDNKIVLQQDCNCHVYFIQHGNEKLLSIYLRRLAA